MSTMTPKLLLYGPQTRFPSMEEANHLHRVLASHTGLFQDIVATIDELSSLYQQLATSDPSLSKVPGVASLSFIQKWLQSGDLSGDVDDLPNVAALPLTVVLQTALYLKYMDRNGTTTDYKGSLQSCKQHGVQGFCTGFLSAAATAFSENEEQLGRNLGTSIRLAMCLGAYVDRNSAYAEPPSPAFALSIRWKEGNFSAAQVKKLLKDYPNAYISCITDNTCVTVTANTQIGLQLTGAFREAGLRVKPVSIKGRFHSVTDHTVAAQALKRFARSTSCSLQYPPSSELKTLLRSNATGEVVAVNESVTDIAIESILTCTADWYTTVRESLKSFGADHLTIIPLAFENGLVPISLLQQNGTSDDTNGLSSGHGLKVDNSTNGIDAAHGVKNVNGVNGVDSAHRLHGMNDTDGIESRYPPNSVAVVGAACRFPGANDVNQFWDLLASEVSMVREPPSNRLNLNTQRLSDRAGTKFWGNFIDDPDSFDYRFFKKSSRETVSWDPEKRVLLEVVYEALESAGHWGPAGQKAPNDYGCYIGAVSNNYYDNVGCHPPNAYSMLGTSRAFFSGRISHQFGFTGPAMSIDTACSSSLVAVDAACRAIQSGACSRAIAGGTNIFTSPYDYQNLAAAGFLSPSGGCKPFDASADGYCRGEGVAAVVLKSLSKAIEEGDNILGVIVGSAVNQNSNDAHITVPCASSQTALFTKVLSMANTSSSSVTYVEAHGTGTQIGDPIECQSIRDGFGGSHRKDKLYFGSVKGAIGHTEASAGVAGLIKTILMMQHKKILGQAGYNSLNPKIPALEPDMMDIPKHLQPWEAALRLACINSYGAAGSNAAVLLREAMPVSSQVLSQRPAIIARQPFFLSAASEQSLIENSKKLLSYIQSQRLSPENSVHLLSDILFNLTDRANHTLTYSVARSITDLDDLDKKLRDIIAGSKVPQKNAISDPRPVVMIFGGQEKDFVGLSEEVVLNSTLFRHHLDACDSEMLSLGLGSLFPAIYQCETIYHLPTLQAILFAAQYACAKAWIDSGLRVDCLLGHSFGQLTALCVSGSLSLHDAIKLVIGRAELIDSNWGEVKGSMVSVQSDLAAISSLLDFQNAENPEHKLEIACFNHPTSHVVVGDSEAIIALEKLATSEKNMRTKRLHVTHGFHSQFSERILPGLAKFANNVKWNKPRIPIEFATEQHVNSEPGAWLLPEHTRKPVYFTSAVRRLGQKFHSCIWVQADQGSSVMTLVKNCLGGKDQQLYCPSFLNTPNGTSSIAETVVELWKAGSQVQFWPYHRSQRTQFEYKSLPPYQFEKTKLWLPFIDQITPESVKEVSPVAPPKVAHEFISFLGFTDSSENEANFLVDPESERYMYLLKGHIASNQALAPASLYVELLSRASIMLTPGASYDTHVNSMDSVKMKGAPIGLDAKKNIYIKFRRRTAGVNYWDFEFTSRFKLGASESQVHTLGRFGLDRRDDPVLAETVQRWGALIGYKRCLSIMQAEGGEKMQGKHIYQALQRLIFFDEMYHGIKSYSYQGHEAAGKVAAELNPKLASNEALYDTPTIDGMMQFAGVLVNYFAHPSGKDVYLCQGINRMVTSGDFDITAGEWIAYSLMTEDTDERTVSDVYIFDKKSQQVVIAFMGFVFTRTSVAVLQQSLRSVNTGGASANPTRASAGAAPPPQLPKPAPIVNSATPAPAGGASRRSKVYKLLSNVTDVPINELRDEMSLEDLGIDSLLVTEVLNEIQAIFDLEIDLNTFLFFPNLEAICNHIDSALGIVVDALPVPKTSAPAEAKTNGVAHAPGTPAATLQGDSRPSLSHAQKVFEGCKDAYERAAVKTQAVEFWRKCYPRQAALVLAYVVEAFANLGCDLSILKPGDSVPDIPHLDRHKLVVRQYYRILEDARLITANEASQFTRMATPVDHTPASTLFAQIISDFPHHASVHRVVQAVGSELAPCLIGDKDALQIVFGNKENKKSLDDLYENWPLVRSGTIALGEFLGKAMADSSGQGKFRILEVGGGTGGTTKYIIPHLQKLGVPFEYVFTDLSPSLVSAAKRIFKDCPEMTFATLDIEKEPPADWFGSFHIVISTNCIHATHDLTVSLTWLRRLLRPDGALTLVEITRNMFWLDVAVGLFEGWWVMNDGRTHAVTHQDRWKEDMLRAGFAAVDWTTGDAPEAQTIRVIAGFATDVSK